MNFFDYGEDAVGTSKQIWIFVLVTFVITVVAFVVWRVTSKSRKDGDGAAKQLQDQARMAAMQPKLVHGQTFPAP